MLQPLRSVTVECWVGKTWLGAHWAMDDFESGGGPRALQDATAQFRAVEPRASVMECGGPPPLCSYLHLDAIDAIATVVDSGNIQHSTKTLNFECICRNATTSVG